MAGLQRVLKQYGTMNVGGVIWVWDYANDRPRIKSEMTAEEIKESERVKWMQIKEQIDKQDFKIG